MTPSARAAIRRRAGITLTEMVVASGLASLLAILLATTWMNFGRPAPIDLQIVGRNAEENYKVAQRVAARIAAIPGAVPLPSALPPGCAFAPRCAHAGGQCTAAPPPLEVIAAGRVSRCIKWRELS